MEDHKHEPKNMAHTHYHNHEMHEHGRVDEHSSNHNDSAQEIKEQSSTDIKHSKHSGHSHHVMMIADFKKRFWISLIVTFPILIFSPMIQHFVGIRELLQFNGENYLLFALSSFVFFYGGFPFLKGIYEELKKLQPGMMTLIALAITVAYVYSSFVALGMQGEVFFWELATLIDIMLLGHWIEMRSILSASGVPMNPRLHPSVTPSGFLAGESPAPLYFTIICIAPTRKIGIFKFKGVMLYLASIED